MAVPLFDPATPLAPLQTALRAAVDAVLESGQYILGPQVAAFEEEFATALGARHAVGVANGTEAITLALRALGIGPGDDVVVPSFTFYASAEAIVNAGARPVFCDIDPATYCLTADTARAALTPATKAVIAVHLFGNVAPVAEVVAVCGVPVLEDAAQAAGSTGAEGRPGAMGTIATFSFYPSKNLGAFGDAGAITTADDALAERVRTLRLHGSADKVTYTDVGFNSRLDELQAAVLRVMLPALEGWAERRAQVGAWYADAGLGEHMTLPVAPDGARAAWHVYVAGHARPDALGVALAERGIGARGYYREPVHRQRPMAPYATGADLPGTDAAARTHLALPVGAAMSREQVDEVVAAVAAAA